MELRPGVEAMFKPDKGKARKATIERVSTRHGQARVTLEGDPFPVTVRIEQLASCKVSDRYVSSEQNLRNTDTQGERSTMTTTRRPDAKALRKQAQALGIKGWEDMGRAELASAVKKAESGGKGKTATKKRRTSSTTSKARKAPAAKKAAPAKRASGTKKAAPKKAAATKAKSEPTYADPPRGVKSPAEQENPFRKGSNLHIIYPILVPRGGKRRTLAERLQKKVDLHPYSSDVEIDIVDYDKRILLAAQTLRDKFGYTIERNGRGLDGTVRVFIPGSENDPRSSSNGKAKRARKK